MATPSKARKSTDSKQDKAKPARSERASGKTARSKQEPAKSAARARQQTRKSSGAKRDNARAADSNQAPANANGSEQKMAIYVYGILPGDVELSSEMTGVGDPPGQVRVVRSDGLAALVSEVEVTAQLGSPDDLTAHKEILDASATAVPVLPLRFGAVMDSEDAVAEELLEDNRDEFTAALGELDGRAQYVVKGRYVEEAILDEVLSENRQAARLRNKLRDADPDATRDTRIKLGEIVNEAVTAKRQKDTRVLGDAMEGHSVASIVREPTHELDAVHVAFLVDTDKEDDVTQVIEGLAQDWEGRVDVRLLGPMAAYDFVGATLPEG